MRNPKSFSSSTLKSILFQQEMFLLLVMIILGLVVAFLNPNFRNIRNIMNILQQVSVTGIICMGVGMILVAGEIDISVGSQVSVIGIIFSMIISKMDNIPLAIGAAFLTGLILGVFNGILVVKTKAASFIITLGTMVVYRGIALVISEGYNFTLKGQFQTLGRGKILQLIPIQIIVFVLLALVVHVILRFTKFGRLLYAIGGNPKAAYVSGIKTDLYKMTAYTIGGALCSLATIVLISQLGAAYPNTGEPYALNALAAVIVGGVSITGGRGSAPGIFLGAVIFGLISNALNILNVNAYWREVALGLIIIFAVTVSGLSEKRK